MCRLWIPGGATARELPAHKPSNDPCSSTPADRCCIPTAKAPPTEAQGPSMPHAGVLLLLACAHLALTSLLVFLLPPGSGLGGCCNMPLTSLHGCPPYMCGVVLWQCFGGQGRCTTSALVPFMYFFDECAVDDHHIDPNVLRYGSNSTVIFLLNLSSVGG